MTLTAVAVLPVANPQRESEQDSYDGVVEGRCWPVVPDAAYLAVYVDHEVVELRQFGNAPRCFVTFKLVDAGEHTGKTLYRAYRVTARIDSRRFRVARRSELVKMLSRVLYPDTRLQRLDRVSLRQLKPMMLRVSTRTVSRDPKGRPLPAVMHYSVIDDVRPE